MYSQNDEEKYITDYFEGKIGKFLDIGAFDPFMYSNTRRLYELGWSGIFVEPVKKSFDKFVSEYSASSDRIQLVNAAISDVDSEIDFYESDVSAVSCIESDFAKRWEEGYGAKYTMVKVKSISVRCFMQDYGKDIDFFNLDVEGMNISIFRMIPDWFWERCRMLCIEHDSNVEEIERKLSNFSFKKIAQNAENIILAK